MLLLLLLLLLLVQQWCIDTKTPAFPSCLLLVFAAVSVAAGFIAPRSKCGRGGGGALSGASGPLEVRALLLHPGCVSRARLRPLNALHIATCTPEGLVLFWDYSKHPSFPSPPTPAAAAATAAAAGGGGAQGGPTNVAKPQLALLGHGDAAVEALSWSAANDNRLASADAAGLCCLWDLTSGSSSSSSSRSEGTGLRPGDVAADGVQIATKTPQVSPSRIYNLNAGPQKRAPLNDLEQHPHHPDLAAVAAEDGSCVLLDWRQQEAAAAATAAATAAANAVSWSPQDSCVFAAGDAAGVVSLFDTRSLRCPLLRLCAGGPPEGDSQPAGVPTGGAPISTLRFHPDFAFLLGAAADDGTVALWDIVAAAAPQQQQKREEMQRDGETGEGKKVGAPKGPPGLLFVHAGHSAPVTDFCWRTSQAPPPKRSSSSSSSSSCVVHHLRQCLMGASVSFDNKLQLWQPSELLFLES